MEPTALRAVFLSYAREDTAAVQRIADALRTFGVEVWFDQSELRGGDTWEKTIRMQIKTCALFLPFVSRQTEARSEGFFRREWKLAAERTHDMGGNRAFIVPIVIDDTRETEADVPEEFLRYQWTRLPGGVPSSDFVAQIKRLLELPKRTAVAPDASPARSPAMAPAVQPSSPGRRNRAIGIGAVALVIVGVVLWWALIPRPGQASRTESVASAGPTGVSKQSAAPALGEKSVAVLPFANLSPEKENETFADGMHADVITHLVKIRDLAVISRPSVLAYRDVASRDLKRIAAELGVATVLEGTVRRAGNQVKISAQLIDTRTLRTLWADDYSGDLSDVFALQSRHAQQIAGALQATLSNSERALIERQPTRNLEAYELYTRARTMHEAQGESGTAADFERIVALYEQAIAKDPSFALAHAQVATVHAIMYFLTFLDPSARRLAALKAAVDQAVRLAPEAPETHLALGAYYYRGFLDFNRALKEFRQAEVGLPNDAQLLFFLAVTHRRLGRWSEALRYFARSAERNPRDLSTAHNYPGFVLHMGQPEAALAATKRLQNYFPRDRLLSQTEAMANFELMGDRDAYARALAALPPMPDDPAGLFDQAQKAIASGELAAAERFLAGLGTKALPDVWGGVLNDPVTLFRACVAFLRGDRESAARFADQALAYYRTEQWNPRQGPWVRMRMAQAEAWAGRGEEAVRDGQAALTEMLQRDVYDAAQLRVMFGWVLVSVGRHGEALACLREALHEPGGLRPNLARIDPFWSKLKDDPRFEEILRTVKPL